MSHRQTPDKAVSLFTDNQKLTIRQFFSTVMCIACSNQTQKDICTNCMENPSQTLTILHEKIRWLERTHHELTAVNVQVLYFIFININTNFCSNTFNFSYNYSFFRFVSLVLVIWMIQNVNH